MLIVLESVTYYDRLLNKRFHSNRTEFSFFNSKFHVFSFGYRYLLVNFDRKPREKTIHTISVFSRKLYNFGKLLKRYEIDVIILNCCQTSTQNRGIQS